MKEKPSPSAKRRASGGRISDPILVGIRQAFYEGLSRKCLTQAWAGLDGFRQSKGSVRRFRGEEQWRDSTPLMEIAGLLGRDHGEVARWFRGESPEWSFLLVAMTALDAGWENLSTLPLKKERREAGWISAMAHVSRKLLAQKLRKNREQLVQKYACRTVRFAVYVKDGKAALKATPVKDE